MYEDPTVSTEYGKLRGRTERLLDGSPYYSFKGVPYAAPPLGELRFKAPRRARAWAGVRDACRHAAVCPQYDMLTMQAAAGSEDCLYLNVYTKEVSGRAPVMVWVHGGGFMSGSGDSSQYGPQHLLARDVVLVTINYRLEVLGFLALDTPEVPGNAGLKDQVLALKWVQENISHFGGDPANVTIFGESAGAASVTYHLLSPMSRGLFHRAIVQSGTCINSWALAHEPRSRAFRIAEALKKDVKSTDELLQFLQSVPATDLIKMTLKTATKDEKLRGLPMHFVPNVEKKFDNVQAFLTKEPIDMLLSEEINKVPLIIGYNSAEGLFMTDAILEKIKANPSSYLVPRDIFVKVSDRQLKEFGQRIINYYTTGGSFSEDRRDEIINFATDVHFAYQTHRFAHFYSKSDMPIFLYRFEYDTELNIIKNLLGMREKEGASHADDLFYFFLGILNNDVFLEHRDKLAPIVDGLVKLWTDFAKTGNPTPASATPWPQYTASCQHYLALNHVTSSKQYADKHRVDFWNTLYKDAGLPCITASRL